MRRLALTLALPLACLVLGITGCINSPKSPTGPTPITDEKFAVELAVDLSKMTSTESGLYYQDLVVGEGAAAGSGDKVAVHYSGWLVDGRLFDSSAGGQPIQVTIDSQGEGRVIDGWNEGLKGMAVGSKRKLIIPSDLAYGAWGAGPIPPYATIVFDVEVVALDIKVETE